MEGEEYEKSLFICCCCHDHSSGGYCSWHWQTQKEKGMTTLFLYKDSENYYIV